MKSPSKLSPLPSVPCNRYQFCFFELKIFMVSAWMIGRFHYLTDILISDTLNPMIESENSSSWMQILPSPTILKRYRQTCNSSCKWSENDWILEQGPKFIARSFQSSMSIWSEVSFLKQLLKPELWNVFRHVFVLVEEILCGETSF